MISDFVSQSTKRMAAKAPEAAPPVRETMQHSDKFGPQFAGFVGDDEAPPAPARHARYIGDRTVHEYRESPK